MQLIKLAHGSQDGIALPFDVIASMMERTERECRSKWASLQTHEATQVVISAVKELHSAQKNLAGLEAHIASSRAAGRTATADALVANHLPSLQTAASLALIAHQNALMCQDFRLR